jgi:lipopolysaccharide transport system permease protein
MVYLPRTLQWTQGIMRKTYFPRLLVPLAGFGNTFIEIGVLAVAFAIVVAMTAWSEGSFPLNLGWHTLWVIPSLAAALLFALAVGLVVSVVALFFRDVIFSTRFFVQVVMFLTPVVYPATSVPEPYRSLMYVLNPMAQVVMTSRWALTGQGELQLGFVLVSYVTILVALAAGLLFFLRAERLLGDQL